MCHQNTIVPPESCYEYEYIYLFDEGVLGIFAKVAVKEHSSMERTTEGCKNV
jgi:hypothetical protein